MSLETNIRAILLILTTFSYFPIPLTQHEVFTDTYLYTLCNKTLPTSKCPSCFYVVSYYYYVVSYYYYVVFYYYYVVSYYYYAVFYYYYIVFYYYVVSYYYYVVSYYYYVVSYYYYVVSYYYYVVSYYYYASSDEDSDDEDDGWDRNNNNIVPCTQKLTACRSHCALSGALQWWMCGNCRLLLKIVSW